MSSETVTVPSESRGTCASDAGLLLSTQPASDGVQTAGSSILAQELVRLVQTKGEAEFKGQTGRAAGASE